MWWEATGDFLHGVYAWSHFLSTECLLRTCVFSVSTCEFSRAFINIMFGALWRLLITPTKKFLLLGNFSPFFFVNMNCRVDFAGVVLALVLLNYCNKFAFFFMWYSLSCSIKELVKQRLLYLILRVYRFLCLAWRLGCAHVFLVLLVSGQRLQHFWCSPYRTPWAIRLDVQEFLLKYGELYRLVDFNPI